MKLIFGIMSMSLSTLGANMPAPVMDPAVIAQEVSALPLSAFDYIAPAATDALDTSVDRLADKLLIVVHKTVSAGAKQTLELYKNNDSVPFFETLTSTGTSGHSTPSGKFKVLKMVQDYWSQTYDVPMPYSVFFKEGYAIHATAESNYALLGGPASHGCVRLTMENAVYVYQTVLDFGPKNTTILIQ